MRSNYVFTYTRDDKLQWHLIDPESLSDAKVKAHEFADREQIKDGQLWAYACHIKLTE